MPLDGTYAFGNFINNFLKNENILIKSDGKSIRSYLYAADLIIWLFTLLAKGRNREIYNVGSSTPISIKELALHISGEAIDVITTNNSDAIYSCYYPDTNKCRSQLGLSEFTSLKRSIEKTINFYSKRESVL